MDNDDYVLRNWRGIIYAAVGIVTAAFGFRQSQLPNQFLVAGLLLVVVLLGAVRQKVVIEPTAVLLHNMFRTHRLIWAEITGLEVIYSSLPWRNGRRIRLLGFGLRRFGNRFPEPPRDAPAPTKLLYGILIQCLAAARTGTR